MALTFIFHFPENLFVYIAMGNMRLRVITKIKVVLVLLHVYIHILGGYVITQGFIVCEAYIEQHNRHTCSWCNYSESRTSIPSRVPKWRSYMNQPIGNQFWVDQFYRSQVFVDDLECFEPRFRRELFLVVDELNVHSLTHVLWSYKIHYNSLVEAVFFKLAPFLVTVLELIQDLDKVLC